MKLPPRMSRAARLNLGFEMNFFGNKTETASDIVKAMAGLDIPGLRGRVAEAEEGRRAAVIRGDAAAMDRTAKAIGKARDALEIAEIRAAHLQEELTAAEKREADEALTAEAAAFEAASAELAEVLSGQLGQLQAALADILQRTAHNHETAADLNARLREAGRAEIVPAECRARPAAASHPAMMYPVDSITAKVELLEFEDLDAPGWQPVGPYSW